MVTLIAALLAIFRKPVPSVITRPRRYYRPVWPEPMGWHEALDKSLRYGIESVPWGMVT